MGRRYGYRPWVVETYVAPEKAGTCFKVAGFVHIGQTAGGRPGPGWEPEPAKALNVYELDLSWCRRLGVNHVETPPVRLPHDGLSSDTWAETEFGGAPLKDARLSARLVESASMLADVVGGSIVAHTSHDAAAVKGHYRFLESKKDKVTPENILAPHRERTIERMRSQKVVRCVQDGTRLRYDTRPVCEGLRITGSNQIGTETLGLPLHKTMALTEDGLPLGVLRCSYEDPTEGPEAPRTEQWLDGFEDACEARRVLSRKALVVLIMDREADTLSLYDQQRAMQQAHVPVRARHDRSLADGKNLFASLKGVSGASTIEISRVTPRPKASRRKARAARSHRKATAEVRCQRVELPDPRGQADPVSLWGVHVREANPPGEEKPLERVLLTCMELKTAADAVRMLDYIPEEVAHRRLLPGAEERVQGRERGAARGAGGHDLVRGGLAHHGVNAARPHRAGVGCKGLLYGDGAALSYRLCPAGSVAGARRAAAGHTGGGCSGGLPEPQPRRPPRPPDHVARYGPTKPCDAGIRSQVRTAFTDLSFPGGKFGRQYPSPTTSNSPRACARHLVYVPVRTP